MSSDGRGWPAGTRPVKAKIHIDGRIRHRVVEYSTPWSPSPWNPSSSAVMLSLPNIPPNNFNVLLQSGDVLGPATPTPGTIFFLLRRRCYSFQAGRTIHGSSNPTSIGRKKRWKKVIRKVNKERQRFLIWPNLCVMCHVIIMYDISGFPLVSGIPDPLFAAGVFYPCPILLRGFI